MNESLVAMIKGCLFALAIFIGYVMYNGGYRTVTSKECHGGQTWAVCNLVETTKLGPFTIKAKDIETNVRNTDPIQVRY